MPLTKPSEIFQQKIAAEEYLQTPTNLVPRPETGRRGAKSTYVL
jgi:hypothetical protein